MLTTHQGLHFLGNLALGHPCINLGRGDEAMPQHLAHRLYRKSVLQTDGRGKGVPCGVEKKKLYEQLIREESITQSAVYQLISLYSST